MRVYETAAVFAFVTAFAVSASANGRYPAAQQLIEQPDDPNRLWLRATYGLLTSPDRGDTWSWICELAAGYSGEDPAIAVTAGGNVLVGVYGGLKTSPDQGCEWLDVAELAGRNTVDVSVERGDPNRALALVNESRVGPDGVYLYEPQVWRSVDAGRVWMLAGPPADSTSFGLTLDAAPSDPSRIYVTGVEVPRNGVEPQMVLLRSTDGGASWEKLAIGAPSSDEPYLAEVHPSNPDVLYVRVRGAVTDARTVDSWLLYSDDAGTSWRELRRARADLLAFALSPDGATVLIGFGDSRATDIARADPAAIGLYRADTTTHEFQRVQEGHIGCLTWTADGIFVCTNQETRGFEIGVTRDVGATLERLALQTDVEGPLQCPPGTPTGDFCENAWPFTCELIQKCTPIVRPEPPVDAGAPSVSDGESDGGCACTAARRSREAPFYAALVAALFAVAGLRRRASLPIL